MKLRFIIIVAITSFMIGCSTTTYHKHNKTKRMASNVKIDGAMRNVMWNGELQGICDLDKIPNRTNLYGLGPIEYLTGELMIIDGESYASTVLTDSTMKVEKTFKYKAPFFVYANESEWMHEQLPDFVKTEKQLEEYISKITTHKIRPFVFKLEGNIENAVIHIQNLPNGSIVRSPEEAHQGQVKYKIGQNEVEIVGFFSTEHKGVFTHHDSNVHMHLITKDKTQMGHLDEINIKKMKLYLPKY